MFHRFLRKRFVASLRRLVRFDAVRRGEGRKEAGSSWREPSLLKLAMTARCRSLELWIKRGYTGYTASTMLRVQDYSRQVLDSTSMMIYYTDDHVCTFPCPLDVLVL